MSELTDQQATILVNHMGYSPEYARRMIENGGRVAHSHKYKNPTFDYKTLVETCWCGARRETNEFVLAYFGPDGYGSKTMRPQSKDLIRYDNARYAAEFAAKRADFEKAMEC